MQNSILLVGGDLCRRVAAMLDSAHWTIWGLRRHPINEPRIRWIQADLGLPDSLIALPSGISHVLYAPAPDVRTRASYQTVYPEGLKHLLDALPTPSNLRRVVLVGSSVVWSATAGSDAMAWIDETTPTSAHNFRSEAILQAEAELFARLPIGGIALRLGGIYGPGRTRLVESLRSGQATAPEGPGHWSNRVHVEDAARACVHLLELKNPQSCYIGTDGHPTETGAFYDQLADVLGAPRPRRLATPPQGKRLSNARLVASGWAPRWPDAVAGYQSILASQ